MLALILAERIGSLFIIILTGFLLVKTKLLTSEQSRTLSVWCLYVLLPCVILKSFMISCTQETRRNLLFSFMVAIIAHIVLLIICEILRRILHLTGVEVASACFSNSGNLIIPLVTFLLGEEWIVYSSGFICVQMAFMWTYGVSIIKGSRTVDFKSVVKNPCIIAVFAGIFLFLLQPPLPEVVTVAIDSMASAVGPVSMVMIGMQMASVDFRKALANKRLYLIVFLRMLFLPVIILLVLKYSGLASLRAQGRTLLLITLLAACAPSASAVAQVAQIYQKEEKYASLINTITTLCCIVTMPLMVYLFQR